MVSRETPVCNFGWNAVDFDLVGVDDRRVTLQDARGARGLLLMFICNHCPYVKTIRERIVRDCEELAPQGIASVAIMSNDPTEYPEDSFENMKAIAKQYRYSFPYLWDETQGVAKAYDAVCTPDFFGFNSKLELQYRGRLDASGREAIPNATRDLFDAMVQIAQTGIGPQGQIPSIGCAIKWKSS